jgi:hypothetical protein
MADALSQLIKWCNENTGFLSLLIFIGFLLFGWLSGIFRALTNRPKFIIDIVDQPTFCCTFDTGRERDGHKTHRTAIVLYLKITNIGSAPSSIDSIQVGVHNYTFKYTFIWYWLKQTIARRDFCVDIGQGDRKVYPFLTQQSVLMPTNTTSFLDVGKSVTGIGYFEQFESWGGFRPRISQRKVRIKVRVRDVFGKYHSRVLKIPEVNMEEARKFNEEFGMTLEKMEYPKPEEK